MSSLLPATPPLPLLPGPNTPTDNQAVTNLGQEQLHPCPQHKCIQELHARVVEQVAVLEGVAVQLTQDLAPDGGREYPQDL